MKILNSFLFFFDWLLSWDSLWWKILFLEGFPQRLPDDVCRSMAQGKDKIFLTGNSWLFSLFICPNGFICGMFWHHVWALLIFARDSSFNLLFIFLHARGGLTFNRRSRHKLSMYANTRDYICRIVLVALVNYLFVDLEHMHAKGQDFRSIFPTFFLFWTLMCK